MYHHSGSGHTADPSRSGVHGRFHPSIHTSIGPDYTDPSLWLRSLSMPRVFLDMSAWQSCWWKLYSNSKNNALDSKSISWYIISWVSHPSAHSHCCNFHGQTQMHILSTAIVRPNSHCPCCKSSHHCAKLRKQLSKRLLKFHLCWKVRSLSDQFSQAQTNAKQSFFHCAPLAIQQKHGWYLPTKIGKSLWSSWTLRTLGCPVTVTSTVWYHNWAALAHQWGRPRGSPFHALGWLPRTSDYQACLMLICEMFGYFLGRFT